MKDAPCLRKILKYLKENHRRTSLRIRIPALWDMGRAEDGEIETVASEFYIRSIERILELGKNGKNSPAGKKSPLPVVYNLFVRLATAYDHDGDGLIGGAEGDFTLNDRGVRETGTFLKSIALLPFIHSLGVEILYLLPVGIIGEDHRTGDMGSPYAVRNPLKIDPFLSDPMLPFSPREQFAALVQAAHLVGMKVVVEFPFRTASRDSDWALENPDWFYWIDADRERYFGKPVFSPEALERIKRVPEGKGEYIAPPASYRRMFACPVSKKEVFKRHTKVIGVSEGREAVIPGAFADWPPDDIQPAWQDVTYLRMFRYPGKEDDFNYMAYNTIRYYDPRLLAKGRPTPGLWEKLSGLIPYYRKHFGVDGVMVDMGHALPEALIGRIVRRARREHKKFLFWEENFHPTRRSRKVGYDAALGSEWTVSPQELAGWVAREEWRCPLPFFGTAETHNTPRAAERGGVGFSRLTFFLNCFLPGPMPFIHNGFELAETVPVNTGVGFTPEQIEQYRKNGRLALFNKSSFDWERKENIVGFIRRTVRVRRRLAGVLRFVSAGSFRMLSAESPEGRTIAFERLDPSHPERKAVVICNTDTDRPSKFYLRVEGAGNGAFEDRMSGFVHTFVDDWVSYELSPGQCVVLDFSKE